MLLMCICTLTIPMAISITDTFANLDLAVRTFVIDSASSVDGHGLWFGVMILTTLVWTAIHLFIVVVALCCRLYDGLAINQIAAFGVEVW